MSESGNAASTHLLDLPLAAILRHLSVPDLLRCSEVCQALYQAAQDEGVWLANAEARYPADTLRLGEAYASWKELVADDNAEQAALFLPLPGTSCLYKFNRHDYHFQCLLLGLEWHRAEAVFRLYFEARGEADLRHPSASSVGYAVHRGGRGAEERRHLGERLQQLQARRQLLVQELAAAEADDALNTAAQVQHQLLRNATQQQQLEQALSQQQEHYFADLLTVVRPAGQRLVEDKEGHKLGYLTFDSLGTKTGSKGHVPRAVQPNGADRISLLLDELPDSYASKQQALELGVDLIFCYANPIPVMPHGGLVDYSPCILASLPAGGRLVDLFRQQGQYTVPEQLYHDLEGEGPEGRRARWAHLPPTVLQRQPPWLV